MDRIDEGLEPACVAKCVTKCLHFGKAEETVGIRRERYAKTVASFE
jgi:Fe-S-cluster-containing dehydrogenase component